MTVCRLIESDWPEFGVPDSPPEVGRAELAARLTLVRDAMAMRDLDALVMYGDREHFANILWASGVDPRFEEMLLIVRPEGAPLLLAGNECLTYTQLSPAVAVGDIRAELCASLSLLSQPRGGERLDVLLRRAVEGAHRIGAAGWKYWTAEEVAEPEHALDIPSVIADMLRETGAEVVNAGEIFMSPEHGLRTIVGADEIARIEFANHMAAGAVRRLIFALCEGMTDFEAVAAARLGGLPLNCHVTLATGSRAHLGLTGPTGERIERGSRLSANIGHWRANICRAGWVAEDAADLPADATDYVEAFVAPYLAALSEWCSLMRPGVAGGTVQARMDAALPYAVYGVTLNPGHLIGTDEWVSSPIYHDSPLPLRSGMALQCDLIPDNAVYGTTRMEDGYVLADVELQSALAETHPAVLDRARHRQRFMRDIIGMEVPDTLLPMADTCGVIAPYLLAPRKLVSISG